MRMIDTCNECGERIPYDATVCPYCPGAIQLAQYVGAAGALIVCIGFPLACLCWLIYLVCG